MSILKDIVPAQPTYNLSANTVPARIHCQQLDASFAGKAGTEDKHDSQLQLLACSRLFGRHSTYLVQYVFCSTSTLRLATQNRCIKTTMISNRFRSGSASEPTDIFPGLHVHKSNPMKRMERMKRENTLMMCNRFRSRSESETTDNAPDEHLPWATCARQQKKVGAEFITYHWTRGNSGEDTDG